VRKGDGREGRDKKGQSSSVIEPSLRQFDCYVTCAEDESGDKLVSVQLDDEESWLNFIDVPGSEVCLFVRR